MRDEGEAAKQLVCLVTGAAGFIGSHLVDRLLAAGHSVIGVDAFTDYYPRSVKEANLRQALGHPGFQLVEADLRTADLRPLVRDSDVVFHLAAMGGLLRSWTDFDEYLSCNVLATQRLLEALRSTSVQHLVHASTSSVYGRDSSGDESHPTLPDSPYGVTKLAAEHLVRAYARNHGLPFTILRYFSVFGPRQRPDMGYHIFIDALLRGAPITVFGDGTTIRANTYIADAIDATMAVLAHGPTGEVYNIGGGEPVSTIEALALLERLTGQQAKVIYGPPRPGEQARAIADTSKARRDFGWAPQTSLEEGLRAQVAWQRETLAQQAEV